MSDEGRVNEPGRPPRSRRRPPTLGAGRLAALAAVAVVAATAASCSGGFGPGDSDALLVYGMITDSAAAAPVVGADVDVTAFSGNCGSNIFSTASAATDSSGRYGTSVINFRSGFRRCVEVRADPPEGSGLRTGLVSVPNVSLDDDVAVDSLRVDIALDSTSGS